MNKIILKIISVILITISITGCSINYDFSINNDDSVDVNIKVKFDSETCYIGENYSSCKDMVDDYTKKVTTYYNLDSYKKSIKEVDDYTIVNYSKTYSTFEDFNRSNVYKILFLKNSSSKNTVNINGYRVIPEYFSKNKLEYEDISFFQVMLQTKRNIISNNASYQNNNKYYWNFESLSKDSVEFKITDDEKISTSTPGTKTNSSKLIKEKIMPFLIACVVTAIVGLLIFILYRVKNVKDNQKI